jgi:hypothetical protein
MTMGFSGLMRVRIARMAAFSLANAFSNVLAFNTSSWLVSR